jgi:hypothetical protein
MSLIDITGNRYGYLKVVRLSDKRDSCGVMLWECTCDCGKTIFVRGQSLKSGRTKSCGCFHSARTRESNTRHGATARKNFKRLYNIWKGIKRRCNNPNCDHYSSYGGRGIKICAEWEHDYGAFEKWAMANGYDDTMTIDRIDNDGNYEPSNCRFLSNASQRWNMRRNLNIMYKGKAYSTKEILNLFSLPCDAKMVKRIAEFYKRNKGMDDSKTEVYLNRQLREISAG